MRQQFFYYQDFTSFNFASFDAIAGLVYYVPKLHNLALRANIDYNRLTGTDNFDDFFSNLGLVLNAEVPFRIGRAQQISVRRDANISLYATRNRRGAMISASTWATRSTLSRNFSLNAADTLVVRPYDSGGRTDVSEILRLERQLSHPRLADRERDHQLRRQSIEPQRLRLRSLQHRRRHLADLEVLTTLPYP